MFPLAVACAVVGLVGNAGAQADSAQSVASSPAVVDSVVKAGAQADSTQSAALRTAVVDSAVKATAQTDSVQFVPPRIAAVDSAAPSAVPANDTVSAKVVTMQGTGDSAKDTSVSSWQPPRTLGDSVAPAVSNAGPRIVAVMPLTPNGVDTASALVLTDALSDELIRGGKVRVMERSQVDKILAEQGFQQSGACDGSECAVQMGRLLGIDRMVVGSVGRIGAAYVLTVRGVDVGTGEVLASVRRQQVGALENVLTQLLPPLSSELGDRLSGVKVDAVSAPAPVAELPKEPVEERKASRTWIWWTAGGVAVVGGTAAAILLLSGDESTSSDDAKASNSWKGEVTW